VFSDLYKPSNRKKLQEIGENVMKDLGGLVPLAGGGDFPFRKSIKRMITEGMGTVDTQVATVISTWKLTIWPSIINLSGLKSKNRFNSQKDFTRIFLLNDLGPCSNISAGAVARWTNGENYNWVLAKKPVHQHEKKSSDAPMELN